MQRIPVPMPKKVKRLEGVSTTCSRSWLNREGTSDPKAEMGILKPCTLWERKVIPKRPSINRCSYWGWQGFCPLGHKQREASREGSKPRVYIKHPKSHHKKIHFLSNSHRGALKISKGQECQHPFLSLYPQKANAMCPICQAHQTDESPQALCSQLRSEHTPR